MKRVRLLLVLATALLTGTIACVSGESTSKERSGKPALSPEVLAKGATIYKTTCAPCHGESGKGDGPAGKIFKPPPRDHTDAAYMDTLKDEEIAKIIQMGGAVKGKPSMPSNPQIRDKDLEAVIAYVRSLSHKTN